MSSTLGSSESQSTSVAFAWMGVVVWVLVVSELLVVVMDLVELSEFLRRVMHLICIVSDFVMGGAV